MSVVDDLAIVRKRIKAINADIQTSQAELKDTQDTAEKQYLRDKCRILRETESQLWRALAAVRQNNLLAQTRAGTLSVLLRSS